MKLVRGNGQINIFRVLIVTGWVSMVLLYLFQVFIYNSLADQGESYAVIVKRNEQLRMENKMLEKEIAEASSLQTISRKAKERGFVPITDIEYLYPSQLK